MAGERRDDGAGGDVRAVVSAVVGPFGFTLSVTAGFVIAVDDGGFPSPFEVWCFALGGVLAFVAIALLSASAGPRARPAPASSHVVLNVVPLVAPLSAFVAKLVPWSAPGFGLAGAAIVTCYVLGLAGLTRVTRPDRRRTVAAEEVRP